MKCVIQILALPFLDSLSALFSLRLGREKKLDLELAPPEKQDLVNPFSCSFVSSPLLSTLTSTIFYLHFLLFGQPSKPLLC